MMRLWKTSYAAPPAIGSSAVLSTVAHVAIIAAAVAVTAQAPQRLREAIEQRVEFLPPPDQIIARPGPSETLHFVAMPATGAMGFDPTPLNHNPHPAAEVPRRGDGDKPIAVPVENAVPGSDSVLSVLEVDSAVSRYLDSAAPAYPADLLAKDVEGSVSTEYIVDTTGYADTSSLVILRSTHPEFTQAVREALPFMRFHPAKVGDRKVRQLVEQQFTFKIRRQPPETVYVKKAGQG
ncbi:MAG: TonB family protein [Gemmatimonadota bacterium]|nr:TonB family protein [Gemmatimonadota bacterium]